MARYGEIAFAAIAANRPDIDLGAAEARMAGMPMPDLAESRARSLATLAVHGVEVSNQAWRGIPSALKRRSVGFASFSGAGVGAGAVHRYPIRNDALGQIPENDPDLWTGLGAAFGVEMALTSLSPEERRSRIERASGSAPTPARAHFVEAALNRSSDVTGDLPPTVTP
jgi:hypothetical protein